MNRLVILLVIAVAVTSCALPSEGKLQFISVYSFIYLFTGADLGGGCGGCAPPPPEMTCGFLIQLVFRKKSNRFIARQMCADTNAISKKTPLLIAQDTQ